MYYAQVFARPMPLFNVLATYQVNIRHKRKVNKLRPEASCCWGDGEHGLTTPKGFLHFNLMDFFYLIVRCNFLTQQLH